MERYSRIWMEFPANWARDNPVRMIALSVAIAVMLYAGTYLTALLSYGINDPIMLLVRYPAVHLAILGIGACFAGLNLGGKRLLDTWYAIENSIEMPESEFLITYKRFEKMVINNRLMGLFGFGYCTLLLISALGSFPYPAVQFSSNPNAGYHALDVYILAVFLLVMMIIGTGSYGIVGMIRVAGQIQLLPYDPYKVENLSPVMYTLRDFASVWLLMIAISAPVLTIAGGYIVWYFFVPLYAFAIAVFAIPYYFLKKAIVKTRRPVIEKIRLHLYKYEKLFLDELDSPETTPESILNHTETINGLNTTMNRLQKSEFWRISPAILVRLIVLGMIPVILVLVTLRFL